MMYMSATIESLTLKDVMQVSFLGVIIGFLCLSALMLLVYLLRLTVEKMESIKTTAPAVNTDVARKTETVPVHRQNTSDMVSIEGSVGEVMLHDVDDKTAAILMAIVADEMKTPLNELRFISIREVKS